MAIVLSLVSLASVAACGSLPRSPESGLTAGPPTPPAAPATLQPTLVAGTVSDPEVILRIAITGDVDVGGRIPALTVYRDGTVLRPGDGLGVVTWLAPKGLGMLTAEATQSGLLAENGEIGPDPAYQGGFMTFAIDLRRNAETIRRSTTNSLTPATRAEGEAIIALAEHLVDLASWLPADAWIAPPAAGVPYAPAHVLFKVTAFAHLPGAEYPPHKLDAVDVQWPLAGRLEDFGQPLAVPPLGEGTTSRCGVLSRDEAAAVRDALAGAPLHQEAERLHADLDWADHTSHLSVSLTALLPEDPADCSVADFWP